MKSKCDCYFCDGLFDLNEKIGVASDKSIIYQDDNVFITPDIAPIVKGHFLIVTKKHCNSFANVDDDAYASLECAKEYLRHSVFKNQKILFFEHGAVRENTAGCCIDHAHMHVIPISSDIDIDGFITQFVTSEKLKASKCSIQKCVKDNQPYIFYEIGENSPWYYPVEWLPHQFFRMMVRHHFSTTQYRWGEQYMTDKSKELFMHTLMLGLQGLKKED
jgi:diadenosine tetraphosphate (Ap4A) HIT family hydrolase